MTFTKVRIGHRLRFFEREDRWGRPVRDVDWPSHGLLDADLWERVRRFQEYEPSFYATGEGHMGNVAPMTEEIREAISLNPEKATLWQLSLDLGDDFVRVSTRFMEGPTLIQYKWYHVIAARVLEFSARVWNSTIARWFPIRYARE